MIVGRKNAQAIMAAIFRGGAFARLSALLSRYGALAAQFLIVVLVARGLPKADAGAYLLIFGAVTTTSVFAGFGTPDGLVKAIPELLSQGASAAARAAVVRSAWFTAWTSLGLVALGMAAALLQGVAPAIVISAGLWWLAYAAVFFCGQTLVALRHEAKGAFVFYALNNLLLLVTTAPFLLLARHADVVGALHASVAAGAIAALTGVVFVRRALRALGTEGTGDTRIATQRLGLLIAVARVLQSMLYWVPAWAVAAASGPADAAIMGAAGRLLIAATAVIAVFRFTIRGRIVAAGARGDTAAITRMARASATIATLVALAALALVLAVGEPAIGLLFGSGFREAAPVLAILLIGAIGESVGGPVDEVLKYQGQARAVLYGLIVAVAAEVLLAWLLAPYGAQAAAAAQAIAFCGMYAFQIVYCRRKLGILILPYTSPSQLRAAFADEEA